VFVGAKNLIPRHPTSRYSWMTPSSRFDLFSRDGSMVFGGSAARSCGWGGSWPAKCFPDAWWSRDLGAMTHTSHAARRAHCPDAPPVISRRTAEVVPLPTSPRCEGALDVWVPAAIGQG